MVKISIIIPIYNIDKWLTRCLESITAQTYGNLQVILVDDGSTDDSGKICNQYQAKDNRIIVIHTKNRGLVRARKEGLNIATGEYIGFVDGDDYILPQMFAKLEEVAESTHADIVHCGYIEKKDNEQDDIKMNYTQGKYSIESSEEKKAFIEQYILGSNHEYITYSIWSKLYRADVIRWAYAKVPDIQSYGEDLISLINCVKKAQSIYLLHEAMYCYTCREDSMSHVKKRDTVINNVELSHEILKIGMRKDMGFCKDICTELAIKQVKCIIYLYVSNMIFFNLKDYEMFKDRRVAIYGAGAVGTDYYKQLRMYPSIEVTSIYDKNYENSEFPYMEVKNPDKICSDEFDILLIAIKNEEVALSVREEMMTKGISQEKIIWISPAYWYDA